MKMKRSFGCVMRASALLLMLAARAGAQHLELVPDLRSVPNPTQETEKAKAKLEPLVEKLRTIAHAVNSGPPSPAAYLDHVLQNALPPLEEVAQTITQQRRQFIESERCVQRAIETLERAKKTVSPRAAQRFEGRIQELKQSSSVFARCRNELRKVCAALKQAADDIYDDIQVSVADRSAAGVAASAAKMSSEAKVQLFATSVADLLRAAESISSNVTASVGASVPTTR